MPVTDIEERDTGFYNPAKDLSSDRLNKFHCKFQHSQKTMIWSLLHLSAGCQNWQFEIMLINSFN